MENPIYHDSASAVYPMLFVPKSCTRLETNCEPSENVFIDVKITSPDTDGNDACIYSGLCNIKLVDIYDVKIQSSPSEIYVSEDCDEQIPIIITDTGVLPPSLNQSDEVWIDPSRSPYVYNRCDSSEPQTRYSTVCHQTHTTNCITLEQHNTYITKNVYNYKEVVQYSMEDDDSKQAVNVKRAKRRVRSLSDDTVYEDDESECGMFMSHLPEEILTEKENKEKEEWKFIDMDTDNSALRQLMSSDMQSVCKQRKTILFLGHNSKTGQTIQKISYNDPYFECSGGPSDGKQREGFACENRSRSTRRKKYQCAKCSRIFGNIQEFRDHMVDHPSPRMWRPRGGGDGVPCAYTCQQCGKRLKTREKYQKHRDGHGNPDLECKHCHKVYASKFTLRAHVKLHSRKYPCKYCSKTFTDFNHLSDHASKRHSVYLCSTCDYVAKNETELNDHNEIHDVIYRSSETGQDEYLFDVVNETEVGSPSPTWNEEDWTIHQSTSSHEIVIEEEELKMDGNEEIVAEGEENDGKSKNFFRRGRKTKKRKKVKSCDVCHKNFSRVSDLKRHLIEHVVRRTLVRTAPGRSGRLRFRCEVCRQETFSRIDRYKAHLREHAKLTLYQCTFCNKSFSDSSNFSKHKKIHGTKYFQCDMCKRKFNSKHMLILHMEHHKKNAPVNCTFCNKLFHFESMLNKHIKSAHKKDVRVRLRCRFCNKYFKTLKEKWDHEWTAHSARKMVADCLVCGAQFRKYNELKRHCYHKHDMGIPTAKDLLKDDIKSE